MRLGYLLEALNNPYGDHSAIDTLYGTPTEPIMLPIPVDTALREGRNVDDAMDALLKHSGYDGEGNKALRERVIKAVNALPVVWASPNGQNARTGKDALPILTWFLGIWNGTAGTIQHDLEQVSDLVVSKNGMKSTRGKWLDELQRRYPTMDKFRAFIERERENPANKVEDETVEGYDYPNPFYSDSKVDVYKASTISDAIKYSKGYTFCIGRRDGSNLFYGYRIAADAPESTVYFCWFKGPHGEKTHDNMCVIHVSSNGKYRMTNAGNTNGSPVVDKETVLREYPALKGVLDKMYSEPLDDEEKVVSSVRPFTVIDLNDTTKGYTRKQIAMLIGNACRFGDDYFEWVYETLDGGDLESGDSLIRKYLATGANRPTEEQEERLVRDGWGEYVEYNLKQYTKQMREVQEHDNKYTLEPVIVSGKTIAYKVKTNNAGYSAVNLYAPLDVPLQIQNGGNTFIKLKGDLWNDDALSNLQLEIKGPYLSELYIIDNNRIKSIESLPHLPITHIGIENTNISGDVDVSNIYNLDYISIVKCNKVLGVKGNPGILGRVLSISVKDCVNFERVEVKTNVYPKIDLYNVGIHDISYITTPFSKLFITECKKLKSVNGIYDKLGEVEELFIQSCPNLEDVSDFRQYRSTEPIKQVVITNNPKIREEDYIKYILPLYKPLPINRQKATNDFVSRSFPKGMRVFKDTLQVYGKTGKEAYNMEKYYVHDFQYTSPYKHPLVVPLADVNSYGNVKDYSGLLKVGSLTIANNYLMTDFEPISHIEIRTYLHISTCGSLFSTKDCPAVEGLSIDNCNNIQEVLIPNKNKKTLISTCSPSLIKGNGAVIPELQLHFIGYNHADKKLDLAAIKSRVNKLELTTNSYVNESAPFERLQVKVHNLVLSNLSNIKSLEGFNKDNIPDVIDIISWYQMGMSPETFIKQVEANDYFILRHINANSFFREDKCPLKKYYEKHWSDLLDANLEF